MFDSLEIIHSATDYTRIVTGIRQGLDTNSGGKMIHFMLLKVETQQYYYHKWSLETENSGFAYLITYDLDSSAYFTQSSFRDERT